MAKPITIENLKNWKAETIRKEHPDGHTRGLFYIVQPSAAASWAFRYRFAGKTKKLTLGPFPALDLKAARQMASAAAQNLARGEDPAAAKKAAKVTARMAAEPDHDLVETVAATFVERYAKKQTREKSWRETERILTREVVGVWRGRALSKIARADVHDLLDGVVDRGSPITANRTLAALRRMCAWAVERGIIDASPCEKVRAPAAETTRDRVLTDDEICAAWTAFDGAGFPFGSIAQLLLLTGARLREIGEARWQEIDMDAKTLTIPAARAKNALATEVPLSEAALRILRAVAHVEFGRRPGGFIFSTNGRSPPSGYSRAKLSFDKAMLAAMRKVASERGDDPETVKPPENWTLHDLRRTCASGMARLGIAPHIVEAVLNHKVRGVAGIYNRYSYNVERRAALETWSRYLDALLSGAPAANVVELAKARG
jgi:integrase